MIPPRSKAFALPAQRTLVQGRKPTGGPVAHGLKTTVVGHAFPIPLERQLRAKGSVSPFLVDTFKRHHDYLRISLTEKCNLRCFYCMPADGVELSPKEHILSDDEIVRLASLFVQNGVRKIRLTGGEPTVRKGLPNLIARLNALRPHGLQAIGMTTNGIALHRRLPELVQNGLTHLNISLDTLDPFKFEIMTRRIGHEAVLRSLEVALASPLQSVKVNVVVIKDLNDSEILDFVEMTREKAFSIRFIEFMPFTGNKWDKQKMVPSSELLSRIASRHPTITKVPDELNDTARNYFIPGHKGSLGFISSMSDHFCGSCNRLRLTADGKIKVCLFDPKEISLRDLIRGGATDGELLQTIGLAVHGKQEKHAGMEDIDTVTNRPMILIGGTHDAPGSRLTHVDQSGRPAMVDVGAKPSTERTATARGRIYVPKVAYDLIAQASSTQAQERPVIAAAPSSQSPMMDHAKAKSLGKGDVLTVAQLAAIMGCKRTSDLIPLCHPLQLSHVAVELRLEAHSDSPPSDAETTKACSAGETLGTTKSHTLICDRRRWASIMCLATVKCEGKTGVEMEALTAVSVGLLTVWDMLKAVAGKEMVIGEIFVSHKSGGKSGDFQRQC
ncbi:molybdenum cofactor biosynthesis prote [Irpex rosettiformis]|uniref:Molybdenum cofactor biosynthesis prote n=1 Tax=Irpex rosettiformis TaxID=378272 RepID=A0ACB8UK13_9APHY|nr:molybdenum cofactor biosynthesis prote [Irpex rosettiformis]